MKHSTTRSGGATSVSPRPNVESEEHGLFWLPSVGGYAGMCVCGFVPPAPCYDSPDELGEALRPHLEATGTLPAVDEGELLREAQRYMLGELLGYHRRIETTHRGIRHVGWEVAGARGSILVTPGGCARFLGSWRTFTTARQGG